MLEINQKHLEDAISELEKWYVQSKIELIKIPVFEKVIQKDIDNKDTSEEKRKQLKWTLETNKRSKQGHEESIENLELILEEVYKLRA